MSPIKGVSDKRRLTWAGRFRLGEKGKTAAGKEYPRALDYFRFDPNDPKLIPEFEEIYGPRPKALRIFFPVDDQGQVFPQDLKAYGKGRGLYCRGDGERATRVETTVKKVDGKEIKVPVMRKDGRPKTFELDCVPDMNSPDCCPIFAGGHCSMVAILIFSLLDYRPGTYWSIATGSYNAIVNINSSLAAVREVMGGIAGLTLRLVRCPKQVRDPKEGKMRTVQVLALETLTNDERKGLIPLEHVYGLPAPPTDQPTDLYPASGSPIEEPRLLTGEIVPVPEGGEVFQILSKRARAAGLTGDQWRAMVHKAEGNLIQLDKELNEIEGGE